MTRPRYAASEVLPKSRVLNSKMVGVRDLKPRPRGPDPCVVSHYRTWVHRTLASDLLLTRHRCMEFAKPRAAARSEAETAICGPQLAALGIQKVGRERR